MLVEEIMHRKVYTLSSKHTIKDACQLIEFKRIRHIPIVDQHHHLLGIVSDRDIRSAIPSIFSKDSTEEYSKPLDLIMTKNVITIHPLDFVEEVSTLFFQNQIGCLPVVENEKLAGIITDTDVLKTFVELTGVNKPGSQIEVRVPDTPGILVDLLQTIRQFQVNIESVLVYPDKANAKHKIIVIRVGTIHPGPIAQTLTENHYDIVWPSIQRFSL